MRNVKKVCILLSCFTIIVSTFAQPALQQQRLQVTQLTPRPQLVLPGKMTLVSPNTLVKIPVDLSRFQDLKPGDTIRLGGGYATVSPGGQYFELPSAQLPKSIIPTSLKFGGVDFGSVKIDRNFVFPSINIDKTFVLSDNKILSLPSGVPGISSTSKLLVRVYTKGKYKEEPVTIRKSAIGGFEATLPANVDPKNTDGILRSPGGEPVVTYVSAVQAYFMLSMNKIEDKNGVVKIFKESGTQFDPKYLNSFVISDESTLLNGATPPVEQQVKSKTGLGVSVTSQEPKGISTKPRRNNVCGKYITRILPLDDEVKKYFNSIDSPIVNPTTAGKGDTEPNPYKYGQELLINEALKEKFNVDQLLSSSFGKYSTDASGSTIWVIDTASSLKDDNYIIKTPQARAGAPSAVMDEIAVRGHGGAIGKIIRMISSSVNINFVPACTKDSCSSIQIISAICAAQQAGVRAKAAGRNEAHIISLSLGGLQRDPVMTRALIDATKAGVTVVMSAGNSDNCKLNETCQQFPADELSDDHDEGRLWEGAYSVGAGSLGEYSLFNRAGKTFSTSAIATPDIYAPALFYLSNYEGDGTSWLHAGTSYATPVFATALAMWRQCLSHRGLIGPGRKDPNPSWKNLKKPYLNLELMLKDCR